MKNVQITVDEQTLHNVDLVGKPLGLTRSEIVRQALRQWLQRQAVERFETQWVDALRERPDEAARANEWGGIQAWDRT